MFSTLFDSDNTVFRFLSRLVDLVVLNVFFIVSCIPVFTIGTALTSLYYVCITDWDPQNAHLFEKYVKSFKMNFKQSVIIWLIMLAAGIIVGTDTWFAFVQWQSTGKDIYRVGLILCIICLIAYLCIFTYVWPLQAKFENKISKMIQNALVMAVAHLPETLVAWCIVGVIGYCVYEFLIMKAMLFVIVFSAVAYLQSVLFRSAFRPYLESDEGKEGEVWTYETETSRDNDYADAKIQAAEMTGKQDSLEETGGETPAPEDEENMAD